MSCKITYKGKTYRLLMTSVFTISNEIVQDYNKEIHEYYWL